MIPSPRKWKRNEIAWDPFLKKYWISADSGLAQYNPASKALNYRHHNIENDPVISSLGNHLRVHDVFADAAGNVFFWNQPNPNAMPWFGGLTGDRIRLTRFPLQHMEAPMKYVAF
jgi:hypothetical protein